SEHSESHAANARRRPLPAPTRRGAPASTPRPPEPHPGPRTAALPRRGGHDEVALCRGRVGWLAAVTAALGAALHLRCAPLLRCALPGLRSTPRRSAAGRLPVPLCRRRAAALPRADVRCPGAAYRRAASGRRVGGEGPAR